MDFHELQIDIHGFGAIRPLGRAFRQNKIVSCTSSVWALLRPVRNAAEGWRAAFTLALRTHADLPPPRLLSNPYLSFPINPKYIEIVSDHTSDQITMHIQATRPQSHCHKDLLHNKFTVHHAVAAREAAMCPSYGERSPGAGDIWEHRRF